MDHHPDVDLRWRTVVLRCSTHSAGGVTQLDVELAHRAREWADRLGATPTQPPRGVELVVDARDPAAVLPFWREALAYQDVSVGDEAGLQDPHGAGFSLRFRRTDPAGGERGRFHLDVQVEKDDAAPLVDRLVAQRGTVTQEAQAPQSWVVADTEGNECRVSGVGR
jgi:4a-hydroxytetrahydrobiopterin dehydratase